MAEGRTNTRRSRRLTQQVPILRVFFLTPDSVIEYLYSGGDAIVNLEEKVSRQIGRVMETQEYFLNGDRSPRRVGYVDSDLDVQCLTNSAFPVVNQAELEWQRVNIAVKIN